MARVTLYLDELQEGDLPPVCVRCGRRAVDLVSRQFAWRPVFSPWMFLGVMRVYHMTAAVPVCRDHTGYVWRGMGGLRAIHMDDSSLTLSGVADEFVDALHAHREGARMRGRMARAAPPVVRPVDEDRPPPLPPPRPPRPRQVILLPEPGAAGPDRAPVWPWFFVGGLLLVLVGGVCAVAFGLFDTPQPRPPMFVLPRPRFAPRPPAPADVPPERLAVLAAAPAAPFPGAVPWAGLPLANANAPRFLKPFEMVRAIAETHGDVFAGSAAADRLARAFPVDDHRREVCDGLESLLRNPHVLGKEPALRALAVWGTADNIPAVARLLEDPFPQVRAAAMDTLAALKDERAAEPLAGRLSDFRDRTKASQSLQALGPLAERAVLPLLANPDRNVRLEACRILRAVGTRGALPDLQQAAADADREVAATADAAAKAVQARAPR